MARLMDYDTVDIYRMVVDVKCQSGVQCRRIYGPYDTASSARDYSDYWDRGQPRRLTRQILESERGGVLTWFSFAPTYRNGGKDVEWDD